METYTASDASIHLLQLINRVNDKHEPIFVNGDHGQVVLISADDYQSIQETLYLISIPGMRESILEGQKKKTEECSTELPW